MASDRRDDIWVVHHDDNEWHIQRKGEDGILSSHRSRDEALHVGRQIAEGDHVELVVQDRNGLIVDNTSFRDDADGSPE